MRIMNYVKTASLAFTLAAITPAINNSVKANNDITQIDTFQKEIPPQGTNNLYILQQAPNPNISINGKETVARIVVDLSKNVLYKYNNEGTPEVAYLIASGRKSSPTDKGIRIVTHVETYPYKSAPIATRRRRHPLDYGPKIICLNKINPKDGTQSPTGEFIHGNHNPNSIGKYASLGCMRMDNEVIKELSKQVKKGDIVIIK